MKSLGKALLGVGAVILTVAMAAKLANVPLGGSKPLTMLSFANACFLLAIGLFLAEEKK